MKTLADQIAYEDYSKQYYAYLSQASASERSLHRATLSQPAAARETKFIPLLRSRLAYIVLITILTALTVSRVVIAVTGCGDGGGGGYLVR